MKMNTVSFFRKYDWPRNKGYSIHEIDIHSAKTDRNQLGKYYLTKRYVVRVGYRFEPNLMPYDEVEQEAHELLRKVFRLGLYQRKNPLAKDVTEENTKTVENILKTYIGFKYPLPLYQARGSLAARKRIEYNKENNTNFADWRKIWFFDFAKEYPYWDETVVMPVETQQFWTGKWYPPDGGYDSWSGEYDYTPGGLDPAFHQSLYKCKLYVPLRKGWNWEGEMVLVHPDDLYWGEVTKDILEEE